MINMETLKKEIQSIVDLYKSSEFVKAEINAKKLIALNPKIVFLHNLLGIIFAAQKKSEQAIECYNEAIKLDPKFAMAYNNLGLEYSNFKKKLKDSEKLYKKAISLDDKIAEPYNNLGSLYNIMNRFNDAINCFKKAISLNPKLVATHHNLGNIYLVTGELKLAKEQFEIAIKKNPYNTNSHRSLSRLCKYKGKEKHFRDMVKIYEEINDVDVVNKSNISFALGKAYEDINDFKNSFFYYEKGNFFYRKTLKYSSKNEKEIFKEIKETFNKSLFEKYTDTGNQNESPIFILGMPRSGTTLIEQIVSNHPEVYGADEVNFIPDLISENFGDNKLNLFFNNIVDFKKSDFKKIGESYIEKMSKLSNNKERYTDKLPKNFLFIGFIKLILPNAKIIHCSRDPKDNCFSIFKNHFPGGQINFAYNFNEIVEYYNFYFDLMKHWKSIFSGSIYDIKYEDLIKNPEKEIRKLLNYCQLEWNDKCLDFSNNKKPIRTASDIQARSKIYNTSIDLWKNYKKYLGQTFDKLIC